MKHLRLAVLLSGGGRTLENFFTHIEQGQLDAEVVVVGSSRSDAYGLERAKQRNVPTFVVDKRQHRATAAFSQAIFTELDRGDLNPETKAALARIGARLVAAGADAVILGCTELPLLLGPGDFPVPVLDTTALHADAALEAALR